MRELILLGALAISACSQSLGEQSDCPLTGEFHYNGAALATAAGETTFALASDCAYFVSGLETYYASVRNAWSQSAYQDEIRPIFLSATGTVEEREGLASVFRIKSVEEVSTDLTSDDARDQFRMRMARDPKY